ncbi:hypothetical protein DFH07DRAFT_940227 [Mycena maculata]|uniref:Uncharacterized protein n=1 Tax=Mycena maculata TaxID=230809 RepID=A0AAD7J837_9AGAR|nr:hypothetical protein DFH07DRAFT_940227 [Mycena maculata]
MSLSLSSVNLATLAIGSFLYGMYTVLSPISMYLLLQRHTVTNPSRKTASVLRSVVFLSAIVLFLVVTGNGCEAELFYLDNAQSTYRALNSSLSASVVIGDALIIYRLWVVWTRSKLVIVFPICSLAAFAVGSGISTHLIENRKTVFSDKWLTASTVLTPVNNMYCTALISWKIWFTTKFSIASNGNNLQKFLVIVVESAGIYAIWVILFSVTYEPNSNLASFFLETTPAVVGIVNALIHTRVGLGWTSEPKQGPPTQLIFAGPSMSVESNCYGGIPSNMRVEGSEATGMGKGGLGTRRPFLDSIHEGLFTV